MVLANARRQEARSVVLEVAGAKPRIELLLLDGSSRPLVAPPAEVLLEIMGALEDGQRQFSSKVFQATISEVAVQRGVDSMKAHISGWKIEHCE